MSLLALLITSLLYTTALLMSPSVGGFAGARGSATRASRRGMLALHFLRLLWDLNRHFRGAGRGAKESWLRRSLSLVSRDKAMSRLLPRLIPSSNSIPSPSHRCLHHQKLRIYQP